MAACRAGRKDTPRPSGGHSRQPAPAPPPSGASRPPDRALASGSPRLAGLRGTVTHGRGKRGSRFLFPPGGVKALSPLQWQGPSPLPQRPAGIRTGRGPKPPASARPAPGGRFSPAGSGAGLCWSWTCRSTGDRRARAGKRAAFPVPARRGAPVHSGMTGLSGRGHRLCHSATLPPGPPGSDQSPRAKARRIGCRPSSHLHDRFFWDPAP